MSIATMRLVADDDGTAAMAPPTNVIEPSESACGISMPFNGPEFRLTGTSFQTESPKMAAAEVNHAAKNIRGFLVTVDFAGI
jgi:hypothetical protein